MLQRFEVEGFKNFYKPLIFDLTASKYEFNEEAIKNSIVKNSIIFGYNGSGKSNFGRAIMDITNHLTDFRCVSNEYNHYISYYEPQRPYAKFSYTFQFDNNTLTYQYKKINQTTVFDEIILINQVPVIDSAQRLVSLKGAESLNTDYDQANISFIKYIFSNTSLNKDDNNVLVFLEFKKFVEGMLSFNCIEGNIFQGFQTNTENMYDIIIENNKVKDFEKFLNKNNVPLQLTSRLTEGRNELLVIYPNKVVDFVSITSKGTRALLLFYTWLIKFNQASFVIMDEFDSFYHHESTKAVIEEIIKTKPQTICTTHNTSLISNEILRPDCYFLLQDGEISPFYKNTEKELRKSHNLEKMYRAKAFDINE